MALLQSREELQVGDAAPEFTLTGVDNAQHSLRGYDAKAVLIVFMCNHCPFVIPKVPALNALQRKYQDRGLVVVGINANDAETYPEDSFEKMRSYAKEWGLTFDYLHDATQQVAKAYGAACTPDPFLLDAEGRLAWHGRIDDAMNPGDSPSRHDMDEAIGQLLETGRVDKPFLPSQGCSIKWR